MLSRRVAERKRAGLAAAKRCRNTPPARHLRARSSTTHGLVSSPDRAHCLEHFWNATSPGLRAPGHATLAGFGEVGPRKHLSRFAMICMHSAGVGVQTVRGSGQFRGTTCRRLLCPARRGGSGRRCRALHKCAFSARRAWRKAAPAVHLPSRRGSPAAVTRPTRGWCRPQPGPFPKAARGWQRLACRAVDEFFFF